MDNPLNFEGSYKQYMEDLNYWLPEGIITVDLNLLHSMDLLNYYKKDSYDPTLTQYFHVIESDRKITLINDKFVIWVVPERVENVSITYTLIALHDKQNIHLETAFLTSGVYNNSKLVLRVLEKLLHEIEETQEIIEKFES